MPEPWTCPRCLQVWQAAEPGRCPYCLVNPSPPLSALSLHGQPVTDPNAHPWQAPSAPAPAPPRADGLDPRYAALLQGVQRMLEPAVAWLEAHGVHVHQSTDAIARLITFAESSLAAVKRVQHLQDDTTVSRMRSPALPEDVLQRIVSLEQGMQQLALAVTTQGHPLLTPVPRPEAPETPYPTFLLTDQATARIERAILDAQQVHGEEWRG